MLKFAGCVCILLASSGMAYSYICSLRLALRQTEQLLELFTALEGEVTYSRCPLPELLEHLARHMPQPYCGLLEQAGHRMEENREADIPVLWKSACEVYKDQFVLPAEAWQVLLRTGEVFSYTSLESSLQLLRLNQNKLSALTERRRAEYADRRKLYCCLCYMAGLFSILLLL